MTGKKSAGLLAVDAELELSFLCSCCLAVGLPLPVLNDEDSQRSDNLMRTLRRLFIKHSTVKKNRAKTFSELSNS